MAVAEAGSQPALRRRRLRLDLTTQSIKSRFTDVHRIVAWDPQLLPDLIDKMRIVGSKTSVPNRIVDVEKIPDGRLPARQSSSKLFRQGFCLIDTSDRNRHDH